MLIADILNSKNSNVVTARVGDTVALAVRKLADNRIGAVVVEGRWMRPAGIFSERDLVNALARDGAAALGYDVQQLMSSPIISCLPTDRIDTVMARMAAGRIRHVPVIENGKLTGIVSVRDLIRYRLDEKELEANVLLDLSRRHN